MTETLGHPDFMSRAALWLQKAGGVLGKAGFGLFLIVAAIAALVATTFIGLMLAIAAVFLTFAHGIGRSRKQSDTLEARRTADGWIIET
ncbi:MAG TPA: hypothetical protein VG942_04410 [Hyphomonadaceae bacterium]|nr:hypothetical protein [Hyphomonadaceae bacterium]